MLPEGVDQGNQPLSNFDRFTNLQTPVIDQPDLEELPPDCQSGNQAGSARGLLRRLYLTDIGAFGNR